MVFGLATVGLVLWMSSIYAVCGRASCCVLPGLPSCTGVPTHLCFKPVCRCRWNTLAAQDVGITLQLLPMLLGFFTYKAAVIAKTGLSLLESISKGSSQTTPSDTSANAANQKDAVSDATNSLDATYSQRILTR